MTDTNKYKALADLIAQQKALDEQVKALKDDIFKELTEMEGEKIDLDFCSVSIGYRPRWKYSEELTNNLDSINLKVKQLKKEEETTGKAEQVSSGGFVRVTLKK